MSSNKKMNGLHVYDLLVVVSCYPASKYPVYKHHRLPVIPSISHKSVLT